MAPPRFTGIPTLGTLPITRNGVLDFRFKDGRSMADVNDARLVMTDRAGGEYVVLQGEVESDYIQFYSDAADLEEVPAGANFEVFATLENGDYKVMYGRVIRREVSYPLNPIFVPTPPYMFEDNMQRDMVGPRWVSKYGRVAMHQPGGTPDYAMGVRNSFEIFGASLSMWEDAAVLWYAPMNSDTFELSVGLCSGGDGTTTIVVCSNSTMTKWVGFRFSTTGTDKVEVVTGTRWDQPTVQGSSVAHSVTDNGIIYKIRFDLPSKTLTLHNGSTLIKSWTDDTNIIPHGLGRRYIGAVWSASFSDPGPLVYYWKAQDTV